MVSALFQSQMEIPPASSCGVRACEGHVFVVAESADQSGAVSEEAGRNTPTLLDQSEACPLVQETSGGVSRGFRASTDFLHDTSERLAAIDLWILPSLVHIQRLFCSGLGDLVIFFSRFYKVWLYTAPCCCCHVRRHARSFVEEQEVFCSELQTDHQHVLPGTRVHVSLLRSFILKHCLP